MRNIVGWIISLGCIGVIVWKVDLGAALLALRAFDWRFVLLGLASLGFGYAMRIVRWRAMLQATGTSVSVRQCVAPFLGSIALNNVLPLRIGDIVRATIFPLSIGVARTAAIGSIVMERLIDLLTLLLALAIGAAALEIGHLPDWLVDGSVFLAVIGSLALLLILVFAGPASKLLVRLVATQAPDSLLAKLLGSGVTLIQGFRQMSHPRVLFVVFGLSLLAWLGEAGVFWSVLAGFGLPSAFLAALLVMAFVTLSTLVPSSPGYVGVFHLAAISAVVLLGVDAESATSFAVLVHLMLWVPTTLAGGLAMLMRPEMFRGALSKRAALSN